VPRRLLIAATLLAAVLAGPASAAQTPGVPAAQATFASVLAQYNALHTIPPCRYSLAQLRRVRHEGKAHPREATLPFKQAIRREITAQKQGACAPKGTGGATATTPAPAATTPAQTTPAQPAPAATTPVTPPAATTPAPAQQATPAPATTTTLHERRADGTKALLLGIAVLAAVLALGLLAWSIARWGAWEPAWTLGARHALGEAGYRVSATWAEFADWLRLGR
jgi:hypothetical protein